MEFEVSSGFAPHQHSAMKENQQVRVIRGWEGLVPPVTLPLQPRSPPPHAMGGRVTTPVTVPVPPGGAQPSPAEGSREGTEEPVVGPGYWDSWDGHPHLCNKSPVPQQLLRALLPRSIPVPSRNPANPICSPTCRGGRAAARGEICLTLQSNDVLTGAEGMFDSTHKVFCHTTQRIFLCCPSTTMI